MDQELLRAIVAADYAVPVGQTAEELSGPLLAALGSPDPVLREPTPDILGVWIERGLYTPAELRAMAARMTDNLANGLGEQETNSVFLRTFSLLVLTSIVNQDNVQPFYDGADLRAILERVLAYAGAERDLRGYIQGGGWAHAAAHTGDVLWVLASNRYLDAADLERILDAIAVLVAPPTGHVYLYNEEERLAHATLGVLHRRLVPALALAAWLERLVHPGGCDLGFAALLSASDAGRRHNTIAFLRALYFQVAGLTYGPDALPSGLPAYIAEQIRQAPRLADDVLPRLAEALRAISVF